MVKVMCCHSQSGRMCCCSAIHCSVALRPQLLQALDLQVWQRKPVRRAAAIAANAHGAGTTGKQALDREFGPVAELMANLLKEAIPAVIVLEQELCGSRYVHERQYKIRR
nr:hypothetical protein 376p_00024 [Serratia liquefaciens]